MKKLKLKQYVNILGSLLLGLTGLMQMAEAQTTSFRRLPPLSPAEFDRCTQMQNDVVRELEATFGAQINPNFYIEENLRQLTSFLGTLRAHPSSQNALTRIAQPTPLSNDDIRTHVAMLDAFIFSQNAALTFDAANCPAGMRANPQFPVHASQDQERMEFHFSVMPNRACVNITSPNHTAAPNLYRGISTVFSLPTEAEDMRQIAIHTAVHHPITVRFRGQLVTANNFYFRSAYDLRTHVFTSRDALTGTWSIVTSNSENAPASNPEQSLDEYVNQFLPVNCHGFFERRPRSRRSDGTGGGSGNGVFGSGVSARPAAPAAPAS